MVYRQYGVLIYYNIIKLSNFLLLVSALLPTLTTVYTFQARPASRLSSSLGNTGGRRSVASFKKRPLSRRRSSDLYNKSFEDANVMNSMENCIPPTINSRNAQSLARYLGSRRNSEEPGRYYVIWVCCVRLF